MITALIGSFIGTFSAWFVAALWVARKPRRRIPTCAFCNVITKTDEEMQEHIGIAVPQASLFKGDLDSAQHERPTFHQAVGIVAESGAHLHSVVSAFFLALPSKLKPSVNRSVLAKGLRWVLAIR